MTARSQKVSVKPGFSQDWTEMEILSLDACGQLSSTTRIRSKIDFPFLDLSIEEYTGISRRAKFTSVRLEDEAARALLALLSAKFAQAAPQEKSNG